MKKTLPIVATLFIGSALSIPAVASATPRRGVAVRATAKRVRPAPQARPARRLRATPRHVYRNTFRTVHRKLRRAWTDQQRLRILARASHLRLTMAQTCEALVTFRHPRLRLQALRLLNNQIVDRYNVRVLNEAFARRSDRRKARRIVRGHHRFDGRRFQRRFG